MKNYFKIILILLCTFPNQIWGQYDAAVEMEELNVLYKWYPNKIKVVVSNSINKVISLTSKELEITKSDEHFYILETIGNNKTAKITISLISDTDTTILREVNYQISNLPKPTIFWGPYLDGSEANIKENKIVVKYSPEIGLNASFNIIQWEISIDSRFNTRPVSGKGSDLKDAEKILKKVTKPSTIYLVIVYVGPDKIQRKLKAEWNVNAWEETEEPLDLLQHGK